MASIATHTESEEAPEQPTDALNPEHTAGDKLLDHLPTQPPAPSSRPAVEGLMGHVTPRPTEEALAHRPAQSPRWLPPIVRRRKPATRPRPLPEVRLTLPVAGVQLAVASVAALTGATMLVLGNPGGWWPMALAGIACIGGWLAYMFAHQVRAEHAAGAILALSQVAALGWCMALAGPRASLLVLIPPIAVLALRASLRFVAVYSMLLSLILYVVFASAALAGQFIPALRLGSVAFAVFDGVVVFVGLTLLLWGALDLHAGRERAAAIARARRYELRLFKGQAAQLRRQQDDDVERLHAAMSYALQGRRIGPDLGDGPMSALTADLGALADRIESLQRDREERHRLETAVQRLVRALERSWLGLPWEWPEPSGSKVDDIVAFLGTPTPRESHEAEADETPTLIPIPSADSTPGRFAGNGAHAFPPLRLNGISGPLGVVRENGNTRQSPLPWDEWDTWRGWDPSKEY